MALVIMALGSGCSGPCGVGGCGPDLFDVFGGGEASLTITPATPPAFGGTATSLGRGADELTHADSFHCDLDDPGAQLQLALDGGSMQINGCASAGDLMGPLPCGMETGALIYSAHAYETESLEALDGAELGPDNRGGVRLELREPQTNRGAVLVVGAAAPVVTFEDGQHGSVVFDGVEWTCEEGGDATGVVPGAVQIDWAFDAEVSIQTGGGGDAP